MPPRKPELPSAASSVPPPHGYRPALDGVRAVAVLAVIGYHATTRVPGGFLGVDVFFVLSGYLITSILLREQLTLGRIRLAEFWARRARRLLPAVLLLVLVCAVEIHRSETIDTWSLRQSDLLSTLFYAANWHFIASDQSYFATFLGASPLRHTWTLAIEEQFYVVWPLVVLGAYRLVRGPRLLAFLIVAGTVVSGVVMANLYNPADPSRAYFGTDARASTLLIGAALALIVQLRPEWLVGARARAIARWIWAPLAVVVLAAFALFSDHSAFYYRGGAVAFAVIIAVGLFIVEAAPTARLAAGLSVAPARWIGKISYSLYLWHWPMIVWIGGSQTTAGPLRKVLEVAAMLGAATASYYLVERPIRSGRMPWVGLSRRRLAFVMPALLAALALLTVDLTTFASAKITRELATPSPPSCPGHTTDVGPLWYCTVRTGSPGAPVVAMIGDSTAQALYPGMRNAADRRGWTYIEAAKAGCTVLPLVFVDSPTSQDITMAKNCVTNVARLIASLQARYHPDVWVLTDRWPIVTMVKSDGTVLGPTDSRRDAPIRGALRSLLRELTFGGSRVLLIPTPPHGEPVDCSLHRLQGAICDSPGTSVRDPATAELTGTASRAARGLPRVTTVSISGVLCPNNGQCPGILNGTVVRYDGIHFSADYSRKLVPIILQRARRLGVRFAPQGRQSASQPGRLRSGTDG